MPGIVVKLMSYVIQRPFSFLFRIWVRERLCRHEFFYNAFRALSFNGIDGDYAEFGCHRATTFAMAYHEAVRHKHKAKLWAFDSFSGLPAPKDDRDSHPKWVEKRMATSLDRFHERCALQRVPRDAYEVVPGFYDETLPAMSDTDAPDNIALAYVDCDLYSSTVDVLRFLMPRLKHGMIIAFDDYFCWSASQVSGNRRAMLEMFSENSVWELLPYMQYGWHGLSFVVESKTIASSSSEG
jgi:hypothetical protein